MAKQYFNWKLAFVLVVAMVVFAAAAFALHSWQQNTRAEQSLPLGERAYDQGDWEEAAQQLGRYLAVDGSNVSVLLKYADAQLKIRPMESANIQQAIAAYSAALRLDDGNAEAVGRLIEIYLGMRTPGEAELKARQYLQDRDDAAVRRLLGVALIQQRKFQEAGRVLTALLQEHPDQIAAYEDMGRLAQIRPEDVNAPGAYWFDEAIKQNSDSALAYLIRGAFRRQTGDRSGAMADLEHAETLDLNDTNVHLRLVGELIGAEATDKAREHLKNLQAVAPEEQGLWQYWADIAVRSGSVEEMQTVAETGLKALATQSWDFMPVAVELLIRAGQYDQAQDGIMQMKQKNVQPARGAFLEGLLAEQQGQLREAVEFWKQAIALGYQSPQDRHWGRELPFVRVVLASAFLKLGDTQSAIGQLRTLVSQVPTYPGAYLLLARLEAQTGDWAAVLEHARQLKQLVPDQKEATTLELQARMRQLAGGGEATAGRQVAWRDIDSRLAQLAASETDEAAAVQLKLLQAENAILQKKYDAATTLLDELQQSAPEERRLVLLRTQVYVGQGKIQDAVSLLQQALEQFPGSIEIATRLALLYDGQEKRSKCESVITDALAGVEVPRERHLLGLFLADFYASWGQEDRLYEWLADMAGQFPVDIKIKRRLLALDRVLKESGLAQEIVDEIKALEGENGWQWKIEQARVWLRSDNFTKYYTDVVRLLQENLLANPEDQASRMLLGAAYEKAGEMRLALATYTEALNRSQAPDDLPIMLVLGAAYEKAGDLPEALATYKEALKRSPDDIRVIAQTVEALYRDGQFGAAQQILDQAAQRDLQHADLQRLRLEGDLQRGALSSASDILQEMVHLDPNDTSAQFTLALLRARQGKFDEAQAILADLRVKSLDIVRITEAQIQIYIFQGKQEEAIQLCNDLVERSKDVQAYTLRARTYAVVDQQDKALADFERAIRLEPNSPTGWLARADYYRDLGQAAEEVEDVRKAFSLAPDDLAIQRRTLQVYLASGDGELYREAEAILQRAIEAHPENTELRVLKARMLVSKGTAPAIREARLLLNQVVAEAPNQAEAWELLGRLELAANRSGNAMDMALRGLAHKADDRSLLLLKADAEAQRSPMLAVPTLKELLRQDPNDLDVLARWAQVDAKSGRPEKTQELVELLQGRLAVLEGPARQQCEIILAKTLYHSGQTSEATACFANLMAADPNDPTPLWAIADLPGAVSRCPRLRALIDDWATQRPDDVPTVAGIVAAWVRNRDEEGMRFGETLLRFTLQRVPESIGALLVLGDLTGATGRSADNAQVNRRILEIDPNNVIAMNNLAWFLCEEQGQYQEALTLANRGLQYEPDYLDLIDTRGVAHYRLGNLPEAVKDFERFIGLCPPWAPSLATTRFHLARAYAQMENRPEAVRQLGQIPGLDEGASVLSVTDQTEARLLLERIKKGN